MDTPGYIDLQINGYKGVNFSDPELTEGQFLDVCRGIADTGTAVFLPTLVTSPLETYKRNLSLISGAVRRAGIESRVPGIHVEGPFISPLPGAVGAHNPEWVLKPDTAILEDLFRWSNDTIRIVTLAAEVPGAEKLIRACAANGVTPAIGHTTASEDEIHKAADCGASLFTHLGNGLPNTIPRHPNTIWSVLAEDRLAVSLITDGHHLPASFIKTVIRAKGLDKVIIVSDGTHVSGMQPGAYPGFDGDIILEDNGRLHDPIRECLAGSSAVLSDCVNFLLESGLMNDAEVQRCCVENPAEVLSL